MRAGTTQRQGEEMDRREWSIEVQKMCLQLRAPFIAVHNGALAEAYIMDLFRGFRRKILVEGQELAVRSIVRSHELAPVDACIAVFDDSLPSAPAATASDYEMWKWANGMPEGVRWVCIDAKFCGLACSRGRNDRDRSFYYWSRNAHPKTGYDIVVVVFEGMIDAVAIMPNKVWEMARDMSWDIEPLISRAPLCFQQFLIDVSDLNLAVSRMIDAAAGKCDWYENPTNHVRFNGWRVPTSERPPINPETTNAGFVAAVRSLRSCWAMIEAQAPDCKVDFSPTQPCISDFLLWIPSTGTMPLRVELKLHSLLGGEALDDSRRSPFHEGRIWHVLIADRGSDMLCVTKDETEDAVAALQSKDEAFMRRHTFLDFAGVRRHIEAHADAARSAAAYALQSVQPRHIGVGAESFQPKEHSTLEDPLTGLETVQLTLPWLLHQVNFECMKAGAGVCLPIGMGHPLGTHIMIDYSWTQEEQRAFREQSTLPVSLWSKSLHSNTSGGIRCIVLRFDDCRLPSNLVPLHMPISLGKSQWKKPARGPGLPEHVLLVGSLLSREQHITATPRSSQYLLMPSEFTCLTTTNDTLSVVPEANRSDGSHLFRRKDGEGDEAEIQNPRWPNGRSRISYTHAAFLRQRVDVDPRRYILNVATGDFNKQVQGVLRAKDLARIDPPWCPGENRAFDATQYHTTVTNVLQAGWDFGYHRRDNSGNFKHAERERAKGQKPRKVPKTAE